LGHPGTAICIDEWLSLKSGWEDDVEDDGGACGDSQGGNVGHNKLCNKTVVDVNSSLPTAGAGTPSTPQHVLPHKTLPGNSSSGHQYICSMFPPMRVHTSNKKASTQMMEAKISFQEAEECAHLDRVEALRAQFATAAQMKSAAKEKGVSWSTQEPLAQGAMEGGKEYTDAGVDSADIWSTPKKCSSKHCKALRLSMERNEDGHPTTPTILSACLLQAQAQTQELGWQCRDLCLSAPPLKRQTFLSVADMSTMSAQHVGDILLCRPICRLSALCR
jgi:hypothetical protein